MSSFAITSPATSALAQRRGVFARGCAAPNARAVGVTRSSRVLRASRVAVASSGTTIAPDEMASDALAGNPLIGITPDRVPMVEAAARGETPDAGSFNWTCLLYTSPSPRDS